MPRMLGFSPYPSGFRDLGLLLVQELKDFTFVPQRVLVYGSHFPGQSFLFSPELKDSPMLLAMCKRPIGPCSRAAQEIGKEHAVEAGAAWRSTSNSRYLARCFMTLRRASRNMHVHTSSRPGLTARCPQREPAKGLGTIDSYGLVTAGKASSSTCIQVCKCRPRIS